MWLLAADLKTKMNWHKVLGAIFILILVSDCASPPPLLPSIPGSAHVYQKDFKKKKSPASIAPAKKTTLPPSAPAPADIPPITAAPNLKLVPTTNLASFPPELPAPSAPRNRAQSSRGPASNDAGDLAQFAVKGEFAGLDEKNLPCTMNVKGWGNDGPAIMKEYHELSVSHFNKLIRTQFWAQTVPREKNVFESKFILVGNRFVVQEVKTTDGKTISTLNQNRVTDNEKLFMTVYLDDDQQTVLGYHLSLEINRVRSEHSCHFKNND